MSVGEGQWVKGLMDWQRPGSGRELGGQEGGGGGGWEERWQWGGGDLEEGMGTGRWGGGNGEGGNGEGERGGATGRGRRGKKRENFTDGYDGMPGWT